MQNLRFVAAVTTLAVGAAVGLIAQGKSKTPSTVPATATFRCDSSDDHQGACGDVTADAGVDRMRDDALGGYTGTVGTTVFYYRSLAGRSLRLYLPGWEVDSRECATAPLAGCNPTFTPENGFDFGNSEMSLTDFELQIKPLDPANALENLAGGLVNMPCGTPLPGLVHLTVWTPGVEGHWGLNYNPRAYHSKGATIVRTANTTWTVEATPTNVESMSDLAELIAFGHSGISRKAGPSHEGLYRVPFKLTIQIPSGSLPASSTPCS